MRQPVLGILTLYLNEKKVLEERAIYEKMTAAGQQLGLKIMIFTPADVNYSANRIYALFYNPEKNSWHRKWSAFPDVIYDRCRIQKSYRFQQLQKFRARYGSLRFLNKPISNKWTIHNLFMQEERFRQYLPITKYVTSSIDVIAMLRKYPLLYLKPVSGTGGRGIMRIERIKKDVLHIQGRNRQRSIIKPRRITTQSLVSFLQSLDLKSSKYIVQQGIQLQLDNGRVHDYRMLVQKNGEGNWSVTGCAGRVGAQRSVTANLHGGGKAVPMETLLREWFSNDVQIESIKAEAEKFGIEAAAFLEKRYGHLCELAFDIAIDREGHIWMIEVNPKPAREVFIKANEPEVYEKAISKPLEYALWYLNRNKTKKHKARV